MAHPPTTPLHCQLKVPLVARRKALNHQQVLAAPLHEHLQLRPQPLLPLAPRAPLKHLRHHTAVQAPRVVGHVQDVHAGIEVGAEVARAELDELPVYTIPREPVGD